MRWHKALAWVPSCAAAFDDLQRPDSSPHCSAVSGCPVTTSPAPSCTHIVGQAVSPSDLALQRSVVVCWFVAYLQTEAITFCACSPAHGRPSCHPLLPHRRQVPHPAGTHRIRGCLQAMSGLIGLSVQASRVSHCHKSSLPALSGDISQRAEERMQSDKQVQVASPGIAPATAQRCLRQMGPP